MTEKTSQKANGRKLTKEQKDQVLQLALQGVSAGEIARQMDVDVLRVSGTVRSAKNIGALPPDPAPVPGTPSVGPTPVPPALPASGEQAPNLSGDGYTWTPSPGGGFAQPPQAVKYIVERSTPQNDGIVGAHTKPPSDDEVGRTYGHGLYKIIKQVPGRMPEYREVNVSRAFGESRYPRDMPQSQAPPRPVWLTQAQTERVIQLARRGVLWGEIARQMGIDAKRVHGTIIAAINSMLRCVLDS